MVVRPMLCAREPSISVNMNRTSRYPRWRDNVHHLQQVLRPSGNKWPHISFELSNAERREARRSAPMLCECETRSEVTYNCLTARRQLSLRRCRGIHFLRLPLALFARRSTSDCWNKNPPLNQPPLALCHETADCSVVCMDIPLECSATPVNGPCCYGGRQTAMY